MTPRERNMAIGILALILLGGGAFAGYTFVFSPLEDTNAAIKLLHDEIDGTPEKQGLDARVAAMKKAIPEGLVVRRQSLPPNIDLAKTQYKLLLERLLKQAKITEFGFPSATTLDSRPPATPELGPKKPAYIRLAFRVDIHKTDIWHLADFLYEFYQLDLLHQITDLKITRHNKPNEMRNGLDAQFTIEAIILDGAEVKTSLFPVVLANRLTSSGEAVAAIGGGRAVQAVAAQPELVRKVTALSNAPVLASRPRDYSLLALRDIFYGVLPPNKTYTGITIAKINDIKIKRGEKIPDVVVHMTGDEAENAKLTATTTGTMLPEGSLKIDHNTNTISFPPANENVSDYASATIAVVALSETGKEQKVTFKVTFDRGGGAGDPSIAGSDREGGRKDDISGAIKLIVIAGSSDGTTTAIIQDNANPFKYKITASPKKGIEVVRLYLAREKPLWRPDPSRPDWKPDTDYKQLAGILSFSDTTSSTKRIFRVVAIEDEFMIVADIGKLEAKPEPKGRGFRPPAGGPPKGGPADPLAVIAGNLASAITRPLNPATMNLAIMNPPPVMYRWANGMSLKDLDDSKRKAKIPPDEAKKILQHTAQNGLVGIPVSTAK